MKRRVNAYLKTDIGREIAVPRAGDASFQCDEGYVTLSAERIGAVHVLHVSAALIAPDEHLAEDGALSLCFPARDVRFVAESMHGDFWCRPYFGEHFSEVPPRTQGLLWKEGRNWRLLWPVCGKQYNCVLAGSERGLEVQLYSFADGLDSIEDTACLIFAEGKEPHALLARAAEAAERLLCGRVKTLDRKPYPEIFNYLGWCSWDALQIRVNEAGLLEKAEEFKEKNIPVRWCIIDDMWAHVKGLNDVPAEIEFNAMVKIMHKSKLYAMEADPVRFPGGLATCIRKLHDRGLKVGMWYPTTGYWAGLDPDGPAAEELKEDLVLTPAGKLVAKPTFESAARFHDTFQDKLKTAGADFVKVDNQSHFRNTYRHVSSVGEAAAAVQGAIEQVTHAHFGEGLINCMGMASECMWNRSGSAVSRCSDDFMPENRPWFAKHILQCAYNSLFQGQFHYSDWDMWWTDDEQAQKNSICRAISGGPIYVSDKQGRSRAEVLAPLAFADGRILRADGQATPVASSLLDDPREGDKPFKIFNRVGGGGVLAVFNLNAENKQQSGVICSADLNLSTGRYLVREQLSGESFILGRGEKFEVTLRDNDDYRLYLFLPIVGKTQAVGRVDKFLSPAAILRRSSSGVRLYEGGALGLAGVTEIATNRRASVKGTKQGAIYVFELAPEETEIKYLATETI